MEANEKIKEANKKIKEAWGELDKIAERMDEVDSKIRSIENLRDAVNKFFADQLHNLYSERGNLEYKRAEIYPTILEAYYEKGELCQKDISSQKAKESLKV